VQFTENIKIKATPTFNTINISLLIGQIGKFFPLPYEDFSEEKYKYTEWNPSSTHIFPTSNKPTAGCHLFIDLSI